MMGDPLISVDPVSRELMPGLAESWTQSDDGLTWTFKLRPDVPFHGDGEWGTVTAEDVKFSWDQYAFHPETTRGFIGGILKQAVGDDMANFEIVSDLEFTVTATEPTNILAQMLSASEETLIIQSKKYWDADATTAEQRLSEPVRMKLVSSTPGVEVVLQARPEHWRKAGVFQKVTLLAISEPWARLAQLQSGAVDLAVLTAPLASRPRPAASTSSR